MVRNTSIEQDHNSRPPGTRCHRNDNKPLVSQQSSDLPSLKHAIRGLRGFCSNTTTFAGSARVDWSEGNISLYVYMLGIRSYTHPRLWTATVLSLRSPAASARVTRLTTVRRYIMEASAEPGHDLISFINSSPTRKTGSIFRVFDTRLKWRSSIPCRRSSQTSA